CRKSYKDRLGRGITQIGVDDSPPPPKAGFQVRMPTQLPAAVAMMGFWQTGASQYRIRLAGEWPLAIAPLDLSDPEAVLEVATPPPAEEVPAPWTGWMNPPAAQPVERWISWAHAEFQAAALAGRVPRAAEIGRPGFEVCETPMPTGAVEAVA